MGEKEQKREQWSKGRFRVCEVGKSSRVAVPWGQCSKNTWVAKVVSSKACFVAKLFLNPAGDRESTCQVLAVREHWKHQGTRERQCISRKLTWAGEAKEEGRNMLQRSTWDSTVISAPCLHNISPASPIYLPAFSFSHPSYSLLHSLFCIPTPRASYLMSWLYLARRSDLQGAPVFICKAFPKTNTVRHCHNLHQFPMGKQGILSSRPFAFLQTCAWSGSHLPAQ